MRIAMMSGACFAHFGHHVACIDNDADKTAALARGEIPIGLTELVRSNVRDPRLALAPRAASR